MNTIGPSDFDFAGAAMQRLSTTVPVWSTEARTTSSWFEPLGGDVSISADVPISARGLSVEEHSERVLMHLRGERDAAV